MNTPILHVVTNVAHFPFASKVVVDRRLVTGQNPQSAKATAKKVTSLL